MKKKIAIMALIPIICYCCIYGWFIISHKNKWNEFFDKAKAANDIVLIHNENVIGGYSEEELKTLSVVANGTVPLEVAKRDREFTINLTNKLLETISKEEPKAEKTIEAGQTLKYGFNIDEENFLNIYDNNKLLIGLDGKYFVYSLSDTENIDRVWDDVTKDYVYEYDNPYYDFR